MHVTLLKFTHLANIEVEKTNTLKQVETVVQTPDLLSSLGMDKCTCKNEGIALIKPCLMAPWSISNTEASKILATVHLEGWLTRIECL